MSRLDLIGLERFKNNLLALVGAANGVAGLDSNGKVPSSQLPSTTKTITITNIVYDYSDPDNITGTCDYTGVTGEDIVTSASNGDPVFIKFENTDRFPILTAGAVHIEANSSSGYNLISISAFAEECEYLFTYSQQNDDFTIQVIDLNSVSVLPEEDTNVNSMLEDMGLSSDAWYSLAVVGDAETDHAIVQETEELG